MRGGSFAFADGGGLGEAQKRAELTRRIDELHFRIANWERDRTIAPTDLDARRKSLAALEAELAGLGAKPPPREGSYFRYAVQEVRDSLGQDPSVKASLASYYRAINEANRVALAGRVPPRRSPARPRTSG